MLVISTLASREVLATS